MRDKIQGAIGIIMGIVLGLALFVCILDHRLLTDLSDSRTMTCEEKLYQAMMDEREVINLLGYGLSPEDLSKNWSHTIYDNAELFFVADRYQYKTLGSVVLCAMPQYAVSGSALSQARISYDRAMSEILKTVDPQWSDLETALYLHDYLCMHYAYDESLTHFTAYELLTEGSGVCQAYTLTYSALLEACGIESSYVVSREMNHAWNVVTIDGVSYNVDVTYDDPSADRLGKASHDYFLCSDSKLIADHSFTKQEGFGRCSSTLYDNGTPWENCSTGFVPLGDSFYYISEGKLYRMQYGESSYIDTIYATWYASSTSYWQGNFSALWAKDDRLLYSKPDCIMAYEPATKQFSVFYQHNGSGDIYGFSLQGDTLLLQIAESPNEAGKIITAK